MSHLFLSSFLPKSSQILLALMVFAAVFSFGLFFRFSPAHATGKTVYADINLISDCTAGNYSIANRNCTGSDGNAYRSVYTAASKLTAGDTLLIRAGTYNDAIYCPSSPAGGWSAGYPWGCIASGTSWAAATMIQNYNGEAVTIFPTTDTLRVFAFDQSQQYIILSGLIVNGINVGYHDVLIQPSANHIRITNSELTNSAASGIQIAGTYNELLNTKIHNSRSNNTSPYYAHGIYVSGANNRVSNNEVYNNTGAGIQVFHQSGTGTDTNTVDHNYIHDNGSDYRATGLSGLIISSGTGNTAFNNIIANNVSGIECEYGASNTKIYQNTIYSNNTNASGIHYGIWGRAIYGNCTNAIVQNNISYGNSGGDYLIDAGTSVTSTTNWTGTNGNPQFVNALVGDFRLQTGSPAINFGTPITLCPAGMDCSYSGSAPDAGAYEWTVTTPSPTPPATPSPVTVDSSYAGYTTAPIDDGVINAAGGAATNWASAESTLDHWIQINFSSPQQLSYATVYWAFNSSLNKYATSQQVQVQAWNGSSYNTVATMSYPGSDVPSSSVSFPTVTTSQLRFFQPANQGNPGYPTVLWVTEVDYGFTTTPNLTNVSFTPALEGKSSVPTSTSFTLSFFTPGTITPKASFSATTDSTAKFSLPSSVSLAQGNYDILIATPGYLKKKQTTVALSSNTAIPLAQLTSGDFNNDNAINALDWSVMNANWFAANSIADINGDGIVNSLDFSYLNSNWNKVGD